MSATIDGVSEYNRLTARNEKGLAYLVNVKQDEQEVNSPYRNTLRCILDNFERLAQYEDTGLSPAEVAELAKAKVQERKPKDEMNCKLCRHYTVKFGEIDGWACNTCNDLSNWEPSERLPKPEEVFGG